MPNSYLRQSPLAHLHLDARAIRSPKLTSDQILVSEMRFRDMLNLRGIKKDPNFISAVEQATGCSFPDKPNVASSEGSGTIIFSLGPDEWLIVTNGGKGNALEKRLQKELERQHISIIPVGEGRTVIRLAGGNVRCLLAKGCTLDLDPRVFGPGQCAQTLLSRTDILLHCVNANSSDTNVFDLYIARSFAEYAWKWIEDAGQEFNIAVILA